jgi:hypothetical protein
MIMNIKWMAASVALVASVALMPTAPAEAGCVKGAIIGGVAGHFAGHHGLLGAGVGCAIGHHEAQRDRDRHESRRYYSNRY